MISRSHAKPQAPVIINGTTVTNVESAKYLSVTITSDLRWNVHISNTCKSAKQKLGLIYRNFNQANQPTLCQLYKALVLLKLDYCSSVWDPASSTLSDKLESVQRFAAKLCTKRWSASPTELTSTLNWPSLCSRQKVLLCRRIIKNKSIISPSSYFSPLAHLNSQIHHLYSVCIPFAHTVSFQKSFFISVCHLWNSLPENVINMPSSRSFKTAFLRLPSFITC